MIIIEKQPNRLRTGILTCDECKKVLERKDCYRIECDFKGSHLLTLCKDCIPAEWLKKVKS